jgi:hypothetical protein
MAAGGNNEGLDMVATLDLKHHLRIVLELKSTRAGRKK